MNQDFFPVILTPPISCNGKIRFLHLDYQIDITTEDASELWHILQYCNGYNSINDIAEKSEIPLSQVTFIMEQLKKWGIIADAREQYLYFHKISSYPTPFFRNLSQQQVAEYTGRPRTPPKPGKRFEYQKASTDNLFLIRSQRRSCRSFSSKALTINQIGNICDFAYSICDHSVPSGGALYPLRLYVIIEHNQQDMAAGYYEYDSENNNFVLFNTEADREQLQYCFNQENTPFGSSVQIVIAADLKRQAYKYSNRGYRLTLIEVGHAAENISLFCAENGLASCELGGILDEPLMDELELRNDDIYPILALAIGYAAKGEEENNTIDKTLFIEENVGPDKPVQKLYTHTFGKDGAFFGVTSTYYDGYQQMQYAGATGSSRVDASFKAVVEAYERWCSGQIRVDYLGPARKLKKWLHPKFIAPLTKEQSQACGFAHFTEDLEIPWTAGINYDGSVIYIPSDIVYYGHKTGKNCIYHSNSSGVAAFTSFSGAREKAIIELIERDAIMRNWYAHKSPNIINPACLPIHAKKRADHWLRCGRKLRILDIPSDYGRVILAIITGKDAPAFVSGAAATIYEDSTEKAINKAIQEAEYNLLLSSQNEKESQMTPENVSTPADHGSLYHQYQYASSLNWLWSGEEVNAFHDIPNLTIDELITRLKIVTIDISGKTPGIFVVRTFSPLLVPINFGFHSAHYTHEVLQGKVNTESLILPHYFA